METVQALQKCTGKSKEKIWSSVGAGKLLLTQSIISLTYTDVTEGGNADLQRSWVKSIIQYWDPFPNAGRLVASLGLCKDISLCCANSRTNPAGHYLMQLNFVMYAFVLHHVFCLENITLDSVWKKIPKKGDTFPEGAYSLLLNNYRSQMHKEAGRKGRKKKQWKEREKQLPWTEEAVSWIYLHWSYAFTRTMAGVQVQIF